MSTALRGLALRFIFNSDQFPVILIEVFINWKPRHEAAKDEAQYASQASETKSNYRQGDSPQQATNGSSCPKFRGKRPIDTRGFSTVGTNVP